MSFSLLTSQLKYAPSCKNMDLLIHIGEISGAYPSFSAKEVWRVHPDGEIRDPFRRLTSVFEMEEISFFESYSEREDNNCNYTYFTQWKEEIEKCERDMTDVPFSNIWVARSLASRLPDNSIIHMGILNSLRSWNLVETNESINGYSNTGGFGIDGTLSTALGASLASADKLVFCFIGDLAFFYDMNALGNRHVGSNLRVLLVNNGKGTEFRHRNHPGNMFGDDADKFIAAAGHYGNQSRALVRHYAEDLGFQYISASNKEEFESVADVFLNPDITETPILFEVFTNSSDESDALIMACSCRSESSDSTKELAKSILGKNGVKAIKKIMGK